MNTRLNTRGADHAQQTANPGCPGGVCTAGGSCAAGLVVRDETGGAGAGHRRGDGRGHEPRRQRARHIAGGAVHRRRRQRQGQRRPQDQDDHTAGPVLDITGDYTSIEGLTLRNCSGTAILLRAAHFHLLSSVVESCDVGVDVAENAGDILLEHNRFTNDRVGVRFAAPNRNTMVVGNTFQQDKDAGLWAVRGTADGRGGAIGVRENHFIADGSGVVAGNVGLLVERNEFANARDAAIHLIGAGAVIRGNRIQGGATMGIVAENAGEAVIDSNELEQFATYAIMVRGSGNALVRANRIHNCGYGLAFVLVLRPHAFALHVLDYQTPGGQTFAARPFLEGNNFRADAVQTPEDLQMPDSQMRAAARRQ
ncbi:MAG: right-handed parallel beta-helix repeat-containing protein [Gammaproteobacteria bacterium]|nr:MAG: right-handed parallel beta-helix repeat-containing protein [Gammaproteobacteria bacterium]